MKILKFHSNLVPLVLSGKKTSTWRLFDDKNLSVGDDIVLRVFVTNEKFAEAKIIKIIEKPFGKLTNEDKLGHEEYKDDDEMYATYSKYYKQSVGPKTPVKIVWFKLKP